MQRTMRGVGDLQMRQIPSSDINYVAAHEAVEMAKRALVEYRDDLALRDILGDKYLAGMKKRMDALTLAERERERLIAEASDITLPPVATLRAEWEHYSTEDKRLLLGAAAEAIGVSSATATKSINALLESGRIRAKGERRARKLLLA